MFASPLINEFSVAPSDKYDWVELYSSESVDISGYKLADETGVFETIPASTTLGPGIYYVVSKYQRLDNEGDTIILKDTQDQTVDQISYGGEGEVCIPSSEGSIARIPDGGNVYDRLLVNSKGAANSQTATDPCPSPTPIPTNTSAPTPNPTDSPVPTKTPTPTKAPTSTTTPTIKAAPTINLIITPTTFLGEEVNENNQGDLLLAGSGVLGEENTIADNVSTKSGSNKKDKPFPVFAIFFIVTGGIFISFAVFLFVKQRKMRENKDNEEKVQ